MSACPQELRRQGVGLFAPSKEPGVGQCSSPHCWKAAPQPSNFPPASPAGAAGCPAAGRAVSGGDVLPSYWQYSAWGAAVDRVALPNKALDWGAAIDL